MILIKLGGSIITHKDRPLSVRKSMISGIAKALKDVDEPVALVHGGGSFGHYWSVKYDMHTAAGRHDPRGVATVKDSMIHLNAVVLERLLAGGLNPYCMPPSGFMSGTGRRPVNSRIRIMGDIAESGLIPITFGDAMWYGNAMTYILSGDRIMTHMARALRPRLCIFALNEDGLYKDMKTRELIRDVSAKTVRAAVPTRPLRQPGPDGVTDVTGGMARKIQEAINIIQSGSSDVFLVNGAKPGRILQAVRGEGFEGTIIRRQKGGGRRGGSTTARTTTARTTTATRRTSSRPATGTATPKRRRA